MSRTLRIGISSCPNDTFTFHALLTGAVRAEGLELEFTIADIEELNEALAAGRLDVTKASFLTALGHARGWCVLSSGSALGYGVGPVLLAAPGRERVEPHSRVLVPGRGTTAHLLYALFHPDAGRLEQAVFSDIMPALSEGRADFGVCIHEGRFTYAEHGLRLVEDLGESWERRTRAPLPLGGIFARKDLGPGVLARVQDAVSRSLECALARPDAALPSMRLHAQEHSDEVLREHVRLYVNSWTRALGRTGRAALEVLGREARALGLVAAELPPLDVYPPTGPEA